MVKMKFKYEAWVHPKCGGDDYCVKLVVQAANEEQANQLIKKWLAKRSDVTDDFQKLS